MTEPFIRAENLSKEFVPKSGFVNRLLPGEQKRIHAVNDVNIEIEQGEILGLVGESGCGKTTLGKTLLQLYSPTSGRIHYKGKDITGLSYTELRRFKKELQIIFQNPYSSLNPKMTAGQIIVEPMTIHGIHRNDEERRERAKELLEDVGLSPESFDKYPHAFSGGQRQRIMIAKALATDPDFIVADEPISALDVSTQAKILNLLKRLQKERDLTYLFIGHNISAVRFISDRIAVMYLGEIVEAGRSDDIINDPRHPYTRALISSIPIPGRERPVQTPLEGSVPSPADPPEGCSFHPRCPHATEMCRTSDPEIESFDGGRQVSCFHHETLYADLEGSVND